MQREREKDRDTYELSREGMLEREKMDMVGKAEKKKQEKGERGRVRKREREREKRRNHLTVDEEIGIHG